MTGDAVTPGLVPLPDRFFDVYVPGAVGVFGAEPVSEAEILDSAARFDPQRHSHRRLSCRRWPVQRPDCQRGRTRWLS